MDIDKEIKIQIIQQELKIYHNTMYQLSVRYKVFEKAGVKPDQISAILTEMEQVQKILDGYEEELKTLHA
jgi:nanoRNase/pAp phosphatase (c-di-AMP/oligoRNAs hydrolase)